MADYKMSAVELVKKVLNFHFKITGLEIENDTLFLNAKISKKYRHKCPICGRKCPGYDNGTFAKWRSIDLGLFKVMIQAVHPRVNCPVHGVTVCEVPWAEYNTRFTEDFVTRTAWLAKYTSMSAACDLMRISSHTIGGLIKGYINKHKDKNLFDNLYAIGIDETSYKKGHKYMMTVINHDTGKLVWAAKGYGQEVLRKFFESLSEEQRSRIKFVTADGARYIADLVKDYCPSANLCVDRYHVVSWATEALDKVRRILWREAEKTASKKKATKEDKKAADALKNTRYPLLKNPENLTSNQKAKLELEVKSNPILYKSYLLKEKLRLAFEYDVKSAEREVDDFIEQAAESEIQPFIDLSAKIQRNKPGILRTIEFGLSNGRTEAVNNNIKRTIRIGYGFSDFDSLISVVFLRCSIPKFNTV